MTALPDGAIDCDIHPGVPELKQLLRYMEPFWQESFVARGLDGFDMMSYPLNAPITCRPDWRRKGQRPGSSLSDMQKDALDAFGIGLAICNPLTGGQVAVSETMGAAICSAVNDWIIEHWLNQDRRLRASIVVPAQAPYLAVEEIERRAPDQRFVQILMPVACEMMLGRSYYWPIYDAAVKHDLPIGLHAGSMYRYAPTSTGWPSHYVQDYVANSNVFEDQLLSLVSNGIFVKYPSLRVVLIESGVSWLPGFLWRAIKTWRGVRAEVPWVKQSPAETIRDNVRLTVQPIDAPPDPNTIERLMEMIDSDRMLLFASDYPHWQFEGDKVLPDGLSPALRQRIRIDNPLETYPRLKETVQ
ncbi:MAG TPA: amidohydrolase family protein [Acetobacteraceae bacterium]|nr:amidohydrolase family protein [Acetobacteraceae bacterium]